MTMFSVHELLFLCKLLVSKLAPLQCRWTSLQKQKTFANLSSFFPFHSAQNNVNGELIRTLFMSETQIKSNPMRCSVHCVLRCREYTYSTLRAAYIVRRSTCSHSCGSHLVSVVARYWNDRAIYREPFLLPNTILTCLLKGHQQPLMQL